MDMQVRLEPNDESLVFDIVEIDCKRISEGSKIELQRNIYIAFRKNLNRKITTKTSVRRKNLFQFISNNLNKTIKKYSNKLGNLKKNSIASCFI